MKFLKDFKKVNSMAELMGGVGKMMEQMKKSKECSEIFGRE